MMHAHAKSHFISLQLQRNFILSVAEKNNMILIFRKFCFISGIKHYAIASSSNMNAMIDSSNASNNADDETSNSDSLSTRSISQLKLCIE